MHRSVAVLILFGALTAANAAAAPAVGQVPPRAAQPGGVGGGAGPQGGNAPEGALPPLVSHRAVYDMRLATTRPSSGIVGAGGVMRYTFTDGCDGWTVETRTELTMLQAQGGPLQTTWDFLSWEGKSDPTYRFRVRNTRNDMVVESYEGTAALTGEGGEARFALPEDDEPLVIALPEGTLLPTRHTQDLVRMALQGQTFLAAPVFDGSGVKGAYLVAAGIGRPVSADAPRALDVPELLAGPAWPMTLAFFSPDIPDSEVPDFEVSLRYHANGVAENLLQDFGDFSLRGILRSLEKLPPPAC